MRLLKDIIPSTLVYLLAHTRRDAYYLHVARDVEGIKQRLMTLHRRRIAMGESGKTLHDPLLMVWHQACDTEVEARARMVEIHAWPHAWQRRLIESQNPFWLDQGFLLLPVASTLFQPWCLAVPETPPQTRQGWSRDFLPADAFPYWCEQGRQWQETIQARTPPLPITRRHTIPVYAVKHVSRETMKQGLFAHGMAVLHASEEVATELIQTINLELAHASAQWCDFVFLTSCYVPNYGWMNYCLCQQDADVSESDLERALTIAAMDAWVKAGKPETYRADLEVDTRTREAYVVGDDMAGGQAERATALKLVDPGADAAVGPSGGHGPRLRS